MSESRISCEEQADDSPAGVWDSSLARTTGIPAHLLVLLGRRPDCTERASESAFSLEEKRSRCPGSRDPPDPIVGTPSKAVKYDLARSLDPDAAAKGSRSLRKNTRS